MAKSLNKILFIAVIAIICFIPSTTAFWRLPCAKPIIIDRVDPIVNPGQVASHIHTVMGASGIHKSATPESIRKSKCSTCIVKEDMSNYWIANLFFQHADGTMEAVPQNGGMLVYYLQRNERGEKIRAFPPNLRMVAGNDLKRRGDNSLETRAISYACINYKQSSKETHAFPQKNCPQGLRVQVFFPSCWDGKNLDSANHRSHMAYPDRMDNGKCPSSHPVRLISIFYEVYYNVDKLAPLWLDNAGKPKRAMPFFWSTGDNSGFGHHGDFMNGWNTNVLQKAVDECTDNSGVVEKCKHFTFRTNQQANACQPEFPRTSNEQVTGKMAKLPYLPKIPVARFDPCGSSPFPEFDYTKGPIGSCNGRGTGRPAYTPASVTMNH